MPRPGAAEGGRAGTQLCLQAREGVWQKEARRCFEGAPSRRGAAKAEGGRVARGAGWAGGIWLASEAQPAVQVPGARRQAASCQLPAREEALAPGRERGARRPTLPGGLVVRIRRSHRRGPGSIPGQGSLSSSSPPSTTDVGFVFAPHLPFWPTGPPGPPTPQ